jgi:hypothetical protein
MSEHPENAGELKILTTTLAESDNGATSLAQLRQEADRAADKGYDMYVSPYVILALLEYVAHTTE